MAVKQRFRRRCLLPAESELLRALLGRHVESGRRAGDALCAWFGAWQIYGLSEQEQGELRKKMSALERLCDGLRRIPACQGETSAHGSSIEPEDRGYERLLRVRRPRLHAQIFPLCRGDACLEGFRMKRQRQNAFVFHLCPEGELGAV